LTPAGGAGYSRAMHQVILAALLSLALLALGGLLLRPARAN
jgi:hypothetical protein